MLLKLHHSFLLLLILPSLLLLLPLRHLRVAVTRSGLLREQRLSRLLHREHILQHDYLVELVCGETELVLFAEQACLSQGGEELVAAFVAILAVELEEAEEVCDHFVEFCGVDGGLFEQDACDVPGEFLVGREGQVLIDHSLDLVELLDFAG